MERFPTNGQNTLTWGVTGIDDLDELRNLLMSQGRHAFVNSLPSGFARPMNWPIMLFDNSLINTLGEK
jgi:hypothetical protein